MDYKKEYKRLLEIVKERRSQSSLPARNQDIAEILGYNRSYFSTMLGENGTVGPEHLKILILHNPWLKKHTNFDLGEVLDFPTSIEDSESSRSRNISNLTESNRILAEAVLTKERNHEKVLDILSTTARADSETLADTYATLMGLREYVVELANEVTKKPVGKIQAALGTKVVAERKKVGKKGILSDARK